MAGIQDNFSSNWITPANDRSKLAKIKIDRASEAKVKTAASHLIARPDKPGIKAIKIAPTTGRKIIADR